jgi:transcriptional regulator with XRE-family HTH domain
MTSTGAILKAARENLGLNQRDVARQAFDKEDFQSLVSRYEADLVEPSLTNLRKLARVLGLSLGDFDRAELPAIPVQVPA